jgi:hypothetical protein
LERLRVRDEGIGISTWLHATDHTRAKACVMISWSRLVRVRVEVQALGDAVELVQRGARELRVELRVSVHAVTSLAVT